MRLGELLALEWRDLDFEGRVIHVRRARVAGRLTTTKNAQRLCSASVGLIQTLGDSRVNCTVGIVCSEQWAKCSSVQPCMDLVYCLASCQNEKGCIDKCLAVYPEGIELYNETGQLVVAYKVFRCWVSEFQAQADLDANANAVLIQSMKLENEGWERDPEVAEPAEVTYTEPQ